MRRSSVAVARSSSGDVALRYVLPVLWMTSRLAVMGATAISDVAIPGWSLMSVIVNACLTVLDAQFNVAVSA